MNKVEKKRQKEQYAMEKRGMHPAGCVRNVRN